ncbi:MAG: hypothetical protein A3E01_04070 [Gammaproteobacteria bacterium RIFCSPHIGHO2_12_FULL_63_22]|nr:MAG: hypothetical protein A3E01_04070 [Gammaproteobacteria bacterium RIFCSPHIGHO2_12_FULL_63_22]
MTPTLTIGVLALAGSLVALYLLRPIWDYRLRGHEVQIVLLNRFPIMRIPVSDIGDIAVVRAWSNPVGFGTLRFGNRITRRAILISRKNSLFAKVLITPVEPEEFLADVKLEMLREAA